MNDSECKKSNEALADVDRAQAAQWCEKAVEADGENVAALMGLARIYADGRGVEMDEEKAQALYDQAAQLLLG